MVRRALAVTLLAFAFTTVAVADTRQELHAAFVHNLALKSFKSTMIDLIQNKTFSTVEFQAPDRYRVTAMGRPPSLIIGNFMYLENAGKFMKIPLPKQMLGQFRNEAAIAELEKGSNVESLGLGMVGTEAARKYRFVSIKEKQTSTSIIWVSVRNGYVLQAEISGGTSGKPFSMRVLYSDFNSNSIKINAPN